MISFNNFKIGDVGKVVTGKTPKTAIAENYGNDYMFIGPTDLHKHFVVNDSEKMITEKGLQSIKGSRLEGTSILVGCIGWDMGNVAITESECATNQQINSITNIKGEYNPYYIYYWLKTKKDFLFQQASVTRTPILNKTSFSNIDINIPVKNYQNSVVDVLKNIDQKIELNNKINAELEAMSKLIYDYWFVQFDFPDANGKPYKSSGGKMVYNQVLKREIPDGWEVKSFGDYAKVKSGFAFKSSWWQESGTPVVKIKDIQENNTLNQSNMSFVSEDKIRAASRFISKVNDVVIAMTGATIGKFAIIPKSDKPLLINQRVGLYDLGEKPIAKLPFLINSMKQDFFRNKIFQVAGGAAQPNISGEQLDNLPLIYPNTGLLEKYNSLMLSNYQKYSNNEAESSELVKLRDWLLPMLMNGQVTVKDA